MAKEVSAGKYRHIYKIGKFGIVVALRLAHLRGGPSSASTARAEK